MKVTRDNFIREYNKSGLPLMILVDDKNKTSPKYPFATYNFISVGDSPSGSAVYSRKAIDSINPLFKDDIEETRQLQHTVRLSINTYSKDKLEAQETAINIKDWLTHIGYRDLSYLGIVVVDALDITDRTIDLVGDREYRYGFDVRLRVTRETFKRIETIEEYSIKQEVTQ